MSEHLILLLDTDLPIDFQDVQLPDTRFNCQNLDIHSIKEMFKLKSSLSEEIVYFPNTITTNQFFLTLR